MRKVIVTQDFRDARHYHTIYPKGTELVLDPEHAASLVMRGLAIEPVENSADSEMPQPKASKKAKGKGEINESQTPLPATGIFEDSPAGDAPDEATPLVK